MPLYNQPQQDLSVVRRTSSALQPILPPTRIDTKLTSDIVLRGRGVKFDSFNPFPIINAGEIVNTSRGQIVIVKTKDVEGRTREVTTVDVGEQQRLVVGSGQDQATDQQAVSQPLIETQPTTAAPDTITQTPVAQETLGAGEVEVVQTGSNEVVVQEPDVAYTATDPNAPSGAGYAKAQLEARQQSTVITGPTGQTYTAPSQTLPPPGGSTVGGKGNYQEPSNPGGKGSYQNPVGGKGNYQGYTDEELILLQLEGQL